MTPFSLASTILLGSHFFSLTAAIDPRAASPQFSKFPKTDSSTHICTEWGGYLKKGHSYQDILDENRITSEQFHEWVSSAERPSSYAKASMTNFM